MHPLGFIVATTLALANGALAQDDTVVLAPLTTLMPVATRTKATDKCVTTYHEPFPCGSCGMTTISTTRTVDCQGCASLSTKTSVGVGICMCPTKPATRTYAVCGKE